MYRNGGKRLLDLVLAAMLLLLTGPLMLLLTGLLLIANKGTPFFCQPRAGQHGRVFTLLKFRTMNNRCDVAGTLLPDGQRLTPVGRWLRRWSLDEWPQLWNVLRGDMSLVGPRPLLVDYLPLYADWQKRRHDVRPGITGWAQVWGRNTLSWPRKFAYDVWYVDHLSLKTDCWILLLTVWQVGRAKGVNAGETVTMERFTGNE